jgi:nicotinamide riboside transporter PnuC
MALVILIVAWLTGGSIAKAVLVAAVFFVIASGWTMYRFRIRAREAARRPEGDT